ncbi:MAG: galactose oxidase-like domain-containing protein [Candidatus Dormibacteria bacterium]
MRRTLLLAAAPLVISLGGVAPTTPALAGDPSSVGQFLPTFEEDPGNVAHPDAVGPTEHCYDSGGGYLVCKPTAVTSVMLPDGRVLFWNGLEGLENVQHLTAAEAGAVSSNSQSRVLDLSGATPTFSVPSQNGVTNPDAGNGSQYPLPSSSDPNAEIDLFCSDQVHLADGRVLIAGGTWWQETPTAGNTPAGQLGVVELQGLRTARIFDPATNTFTGVSPMNYGRWYPDLVELASGDVFVGGGVRKLIQTDGTNVRYTETFHANQSDPAYGTWTVNGTDAMHLSGQNALPLFPRFHLLPNNTVYYTGVGQMWGPFGQSADEALYGLRSSYDPATQAWTYYDTGLLGARSGAFSVMLPMKPDASNSYNHVDILVGGGTLGSPPGSYIANNLTEIQSLDASTNWKPTATLGPQLQNRRWYSSGVVLPNDAVAIFNGADKDEVIVPGTESPVRQVEWYAPWLNGGTGGFENLASASRDRTYHNTAILLPDGSVLVGGHAPINAYYGNASNQTHDATAGTPIATANNFKDPSFEIYQPPYMFKGDRPAIDQVQQGIAWGSTFNLESTTAAADISSVRLIRLPSLTHITDANMRSLELPFTVTGPNTISITAPPDGGAAPPGPYYLFINKGTGADAVPSVAAMVSLGQNANLTPAEIPSYDATATHLPVSATVPAPPVAVAAKSAPATVASAPAAARPVSRSVRLTSAVRPQLPVRDVPVGLWALLLAAAGVAVVLGGRVAARARK